MCSMADTARLSMGPSAAFGQDEQKRRTAAAIAIILSRKQIRETSEWRERAAAAEEQLAVAKSLLQTAWKASNATDDNTELDTVRMDALGPGTPYPAFETGPSQTHSASTDTCALGRQHGLEVILHHACQLLPPSIVEHDAWQPWRDTRTPQSNHKALTFIDALLALPASDLRRCHLSACVTVLAAAVHNAIAAAPAEPLICRTARDVLQLSKHLLEASAQQTPSTGTPARPRADAALLALQTMQSHSGGHLLQVLMLACAQECEAAAAAAEAPQQPSHTTSLKHTMQHQRQHSIAVDMLLGCLDHLPCALEHQAASTTDTAQQGGLFLLQEAVTVMCNAWTCLQRPALPCLLMALRAGLLRVMARMATVLQQICKGPRPLDTDQHDALPSTHVEAMQEACLRMCMQLRRSFEP